MFYLRDKIIRNKTASLLFVVERDISVKSSSSKLTTEDIALRINKSP